MGVLLRTVNLLTPASVPPSPPVSVPPSPPVSVPPPVSLPSTSELQALQTNSMKFLVCPTVEGLPLLFCSNGNPLFLT